ncbi:MAG TPA: AarF/ABC1/UbiB kinase family protein [Thermoanaerobaculia bacterium]|nr:AarF/ABC1/UbiB kinase family protein [Thermoanaerobaculia bacterium]
MRTEHLKRYRDLAGLLWKYGRSDLARLPGLDGQLGEPPQADPATSPDAEELAADLERMGPTFVKVGQLLSTRADLLPPPYLAALSRLQDRVEPFPFADVERIVVEELGVRISKAFAEFETTPMASASLAQVHRAVLRDGREVAVKVQRPGIREEVARDLDVFAEIAEMAEKHTETGRRYQLMALVEEFRRSLLRELDYQREAAHLQALRTSLAEFDRLVVPAPIEGYSTGRVLTMERISGTKVDKLSPVVRTDLDGAELAEQLIGGYLHQILVDGFFHADPHPGNVLLTHDHRVALLDLGMVGHLAPSLQEQLLKLLAAITEGQGDEAAELVVRIGTRQPDFDPPLFRRRITELVAEHRGLALEQLQVGRVVLELVSLASATGIHAPPELALLGKTLLNLDLVVRSLDPTLNVTESIRRQLITMARKRVWRTTTPGSAFRAFSEGRELLAQLPSRLNRILDTIADNQLRINVDAIDETELIKGFQKVANRISGGLLLAALIVGAAMMLQVPTRFTLFGYPGLAIIFFLLAAAGGVWMLWTILSSDK